VLHIFSAHGYSLTAMRKYYSAVRGVAGTTFFANQKRLISAPQLIVDNWNNCIITVYTECTSLYPESCVSSIPWYVLCGCVTSTWLTSSYIVSAQSLLDRSYKSAQMWPCQISQLWMACGQQHTHSQRNLQVDCNHSTIRDMRWIQVYQDLCTQGHC